MTCPICQLPGTHHVPSQCVAGQVGEPARIRYSERDRLLSAALSALDGLLSERQIDRPSMAEGAARYVARMLREAGVQPAGGEVTRGDTA